MENVSGSNPPEAAWRLMDASYSTVCEWIYCGAAAG